ncbi:MAG: AraC family transcriptional regulator [Oscillospiraceae bacterium]|nr:AraC family transcriptional regulator [Oscillospiraceae bacterium]
MNPDLHDLKPILAGSSKSLPDEVNGSQRSDCVVLYYVTAGSGTFYIKDEQYAAKKGQAFMILPGETASWRASHHDPWSYQWVGFTGSLSHRFSELPPVFDVPDGVFAPLESLRAMNTHTEYRLTSELFQLFFLLLEPKRENRSYVQQVADLIQSSYMQHLTVEEIAKQFRMDRSYLNRQFKKATGQSIKEYITNVRLDRAAWYLARGYTVKETAGLCGFNDVSNFSKAFKHHHSNNMSPQQWRSHITGVHKENALLTSSNKALKK